MRTFSEAAQRRRRPFPTPETREDRSDLTEDRREGARIAGHWTGEHEAAEAADRALQDVGDKDRDAGFRPDREGHIRRSGVAGADRPGVRTARQTSCDEGARDAPKEVARDCS